MSNQLPHSNLLIAIDCVMFCSIVGNVKLLDYNTVPLYFSVYVGKVGTFVAGAVLVSVLVIIYRLVEQRRC